MRLCSRTINNVDVAITSMLFIILASRRTAAKVFIFHFISVARIRCTSLHRQGNPIRLAVAEDISQTLADHLLVQQVHGPAAYTCGPFLGLPGFGRCKCLE